MKKYIFLTKTEVEGEIEYFAVSESEIETMAVSDTYADHGQRVSSSEAGDYLELLTEKAVSIANQIYHNNHADYDDSEVLQKFKIGDIVSAYDFNEFDEIVSNSELVDSVDIDVTKQQCKGFNYWDGTVNNYKSIIVEHDYSDVLEWKIVDDVALVKYLRTAITRKKWDSKGAGFDFYKYGKVDITESYWQGAWEAYKLTMN